MSTDAASLPEDVTLLQALVRQLLEANAQLERRSAQLEHQLDQLLRRLFGPRFRSSRPAENLHLPETRHAWRTTASPSAAAQRQGA